MTDDAKSALTSGGRYEKRAVVLVCAVIVMSLWMLIVLSVLWLLGLT